MFALGHKLKKRMKLSSLSSNSSYIRSRSITLTQHSNDDTNVSKTTKRVYTNKADLNEYNDVNETPRTIWSASKTNQRSNDAATSLFNTPKSHNAHEKRVLGDGLDSQDQDKQRKRKRKRLDPYGTSITRIDNDDHVVLDGYGVKNKKDAMKSLEMSSNAQFHALQPSHSIMTYVEENLLGHRRLIELMKAGYNVELSAPLDNNPNLTKTERVRIKESVYRNKLKLLAAANVSSSFPPPDVPEIAFAGRSNVGKSSLLNAFTRQWGVLRTSDKPGLTQDINFFGLGPKVRLVDLPGYGFAFEKDEVTEAWEDLVRICYLLNYVLLSRSMISV